MSESTPTNPEYVSTMTISEIMDAVHSRQFADTSEMGRALIAEWTRRNDERDAARRFNRAPVQADYSRHAVRYVA